MAISKLMGGLPSRLMPQTVFDAASEKLMSELPLWGAEANALATNVNALEASTTLKAAAAAASALLAQTAATSSVAAADLVATSSDIRTFATGDITFNININKGFRPGMTIVSADTVAPGRKFIGFVRTYNPSTGVLVMGVDAVTAGGSSNAWTISISGQYVVPFAAGGAYADYALAADRLLPSTSARLQVVSPQVAGLNFTLGNALNLTPGQAQFTLSNAVQPSSLNALAYDLGVEDTFGALKGFVLPDESVRVGLVDATTAAGIWSFEGISPIGVAARLLANASTVIGGVNGMFVKAFPLDADRIWLLLYGISLHAVIYNRTTNQFGGVVLVRTAFAAAGAIDNVMAVQHSIAGQLMVVSVGEGSTAANAVVLFSTGNTVTPGTAQPITLGAASARLIDLVQVGSAFVFAYLNGTTSVRFRALTHTGFAAPVAGAEPTALTSTAPPALLPIDGTSVALMTASATVLTITPYAISGAALGIGTPATTTVTSASSITVKPAAGAGTSQRWFLAFLNSGAKVSIVGFTSGPSPVAAITTPANASPSLTTVTGFANIGYANTIATAAYGTFSTGEFGAEFYSYTDTGSGLSLNNSALNFVSCSAAVTSAVPLAVDNLGASGFYVNWQVVTAKEVMLYSCRELASINFFTPGRPARKGVIPGALALPVPAIYPKANLAGGTLTAPGSSRSVSLGDGSKPPLYCANGAIGPRALPINLNIPGDTANASQGFDTSSIWMGYSQGPNLAFDLLQVRLA